MKTIILTLLLSTGASAASTVQPCEQVKAVYAQILPQVKDSSWSREGDVCTIEYTPKDGVTVTFTDRKVIREALLDELAAIEISIDAGNETAAQRRRWMKINMILNGWARRP